LDNNNCSNIFLYRHFNICEPIGEFIIDNPALKILALSFLISIGITIFMEGFHKEVPKAYIYLPMGFALAVELLQMRYSRNKKTKKLPNEIL